MKRKLAIYGAGGFGRETVVMIDQINRKSSSWELTGFFDDFTQDSDVDGIKVIGGIDQLNTFPEKLAVCVAVADPQIRSRLVKKITNEKIDFPVLVHPEANIGDENRNKFGRGCLITAGVILTTAVEMGEFCIINLSCTAGHDVRLGAYCTIMPGCHISGNVSIGRESVMGTGSKIIQGKTIGDRNVIGAGALVTKDFGSGLRIMGIPARAIKSS